MAGPERHDGGPDERFIRLTAIEGWDQAVLGAAKILVVGAGALGNEVIKNLALLGIGNLVVVDFDRVESSNLTRSILFRERDCGQLKAECAVRAAREIYPAMQARAHVGDVLADVGLGCFRWADVVIGALDNREARVFVNAACARVGTPWLDGGIGAFSGIARGFLPPAGACYECTMSARDWQLLQQRRSCTLLGRALAAAGGTPTTPTAASIIGGIQVQEAVKILHGDAGFLGRGFVFDGRAHQSYAVTYVINPACRWHEPPAPVVGIPGTADATALAAVVACAREHLGGCDGLEFARELVLRRECPGCGRADDVLKPAARIEPDDLLCVGCRQETRLDLAHGLGADSPHLRRTAAEIGLPAWDIVWARCGDHDLGIELAGDRPML